MDMADAFNIPRILGIISVIIAFILLHFTPAPLAYPAFFFFLMLTLFLLSLLAEAIYNHKQKRTHATHR